MGRLTIDVYTFVERGDRVETANISYPLPYAGRLLPSQPTIEDVRKVLPDLAAIVVSIISHVADRYERSPDPGWVDTKFHIVTGEDFPPDDVRGPQTIYGWIQGRALESLVGHAVWIEAHPWADPEGKLLPRLQKMIRELYERLDAVRRQNNGRLFFFLDPTGRPFTFSSTGERVPFDLDPKAPYNFSDLFGSRGLLAAARYLGDRAAIHEARTYCLAVEDGILAGHFRSDQQKLPPYPKSESQEPPKPRHSHAPYTIQLATPAMMTLHWKDASYVGRGLRLMQHVMERHINLDGRQPNLHRFDFWEFVDDDGRPNIENGQLLSDPGHSLEFVGLGLKLTRAARSVGVSADRLESVEVPMHGVLNRCFENGFVAQTGGIYKAVDLLSGKPLDESMPWWSLPETMRAAAGCWAIGTTEQKARALEIFAACHNSFVSHYVRPDRHLFAVQTRHGRTGEVIDVIPATADADPGYHTGLSLIDVLDIIEEETGPIDPRS